MSILVRAQAVQKTFDKFSYKPFKYGKYDCAHLCADVIKNLGYPDPLTGLRKYDTRLGAIRAMRKFGIKTFAEKLDQLFERIAPAETLPGDILAIQSDDPLLGTLGLRVSGNHLLAYADVPDGVRCALMPYTVAHAAWRVAV